jgi:hypothetical protein
MRPGLAFLVIGAALAASVQGAAPPQFNSRDTEQAVTVEGCLSGNRLKPELDSPNTNMVFKELQVKEFRLEGTKALLKEHDGHQDEFSGVVYVPQGRDVTVKGKQVGTRTRITTTQSGGNPDPRLAGGTRVADPKTITDPQDKLETRKWLRMKVTSVKHVSDKCSVTAKGGQFPTDSPGPN